MRVKLRRRTQTESDERTEQVVAIQEMERLHPDEERWSRARRALEEGKELAHKVYRRLT